MQTTGQRLASVRMVLRRAAALAQGWRRLTEGRYRPEKHYMRGPGPKWREKYAHAGAQRSAQAARRG
jgi:hypothetical protein